MAEPSKSLYDTLLNKAYITRDARFEAERRIRMRRHHANVSTVILSLSVIIFNILPLSKKFAEYAEPITVVTILLSTVILAITLLVSGLNYSEKEIAFHQCAVKMSGFIDKLRCKKNDIKESQMLSYYEEYNRIVNESNYNHSNIDYKRALQRNNEIKKWRKWNNICIWIRWHLLDLHSLYLYLSLLLPAIAACVIFCCWNEKV
ncbi:MAG: SLATT domain-containing protein [Muribaculaceae bacterium]|nr:SLATT domain-containing protein [Muribaculaceae bacterium]